MPLTPPRSASLALPSLPLVVLAVLSSCAAPVNPPAPAETSPVDGPPQSTPRGPRGMADASGAGMVEAATPVDAPVAVDAPIAASVDAGGAVDGRVPIDSRVTVDVSIDTDTLVDDPNLPVVMLEVPNTAYDKIGSTKVSGSIKVVVRHDGTHRDLAAATAELAMPIGISLRGSSSAGFPQKSFSVELRDAAGMEKKSPLLGMPAEADWALVACWTDKPCLRNPLAYEVGRAMGRWNPRTRFVEVFWNGAYQGLYLLTEAPRQDRNRIDIPKPAADAAAGDITGGYIVRREAGGKGAPENRPVRDWASPVKAPDQWGHRTVYTYHYPNELAITPAQKTYIQGHMARFETVMAGAGWADPEKGYRTLIDVESWIDFALINEVTANVDGYWKSMYFTKESDARGGKLFLTPFWDFNIAFGNADYRDGWKTDVLTSKLNRFGGECSYWLPREPPLCDYCCNARPNCAAPSKCWNMPYVPFYWDRLWTDARFLGDMKCRWRKLREANGPLTMAFVDGLLDRWKKQLLPRAVPRHFARWPALRDYQWPNPYRVDPTTVPKGPTADKFFEGEVAWLRAWIQRRLTWLDGNLPGACG